MLNRIVNISAGSDFKSASKPFRGAKFDRTNASQGYRPDSIAISPAYNFLAKHNWKIKELIMEGEKLHISFFLSGFEFLTVIPLKQINQLPSIEYTVIKEKEIDKAKRRIAAEFIVNIAEINYGREEFNFNLVKMEAFFNRLIHLRLNGELGPAERKSLDELLEGLAEGMQEEFNEINNGIFIFIEKYFNFKITIGAKKVNINNPVFLVKVRPNS